MGVIKMSRQDLIELYQLCDMFRVLDYNDSEKTAEKLLERVAHEYQTTYNGDITAARNPRGAGRKKVYPEKTDQEILRLRSQGMLIREIARKAGCSAGHVQYVITKERGDI